MDIFWQHEHFATESEAKDFADRMDSSFVIDGIEWEGNYDQWAVIYATASELNDFYADEEED